MKTLIYRSLLQVSQSQFSREKRIGDVGPVLNIITQCDVRRFVPEAQPCAKGILVRPRAREGCVARHNGTRPEIEIRASISNEELKSS